METQLPAARDACRPMETSNQSNDDATSDEQWKKWGPYVAERAWGTVREDFTKSGKSWEELKYEQGLTTAYRLGEDGIFGFCDTDGRLNASFAFWNGKDSVLKERLFGLTPLESPIGEGVRECYWNGPCHPQYKYFSCRYRYPHEKFPYTTIRSIEAQRFGSAPKPPVTLEEIGLFKNNKYYDVDFEVAKSDPTRMFYRVTLNNRSGVNNGIDVLAQLAFRNTWGTLGGNKTEVIQQVTGGVLYCKWQDESTGKEEKYYMYYDDSQPNVQVLFAENETGKKDAFNRLIVAGESDKLNHGFGTKAAVRYHVMVPPNCSRTLTFLLSRRDNETPVDWKSADSIFESSLEETRERLLQSVSPGVPKEFVNLNVRAISSVLWNRQFYNFQSDQKISDCFDDIRIKTVVTVPDKWEHPYMASWDCGFQALMLARVDPLQAKREILTQLDLMLDSGRLPCDEFLFDRVPPPVMPLPLLEIDRIHGAKERQFLVSATQKLLSHLHWWITRKDRSGKSVLEGGILGVDFVSLMEINDEHESNDSLVWTGLYTAKMMELAVRLELAEAPKLLEMLESAASALRHAGTFVNGFFLPKFRVDEQEDVVVDCYYSYGFVPLLGCAVLNRVAMESDCFDRGMHDRIQWLLWACSESQENPALFCKENMENGCVLLSCISPEQLRSICSVVFDEAKFLTPRGIRSMSQQHRASPISVGSYSAAYYDGETHKSSVNYGGNSNWTGCVSPPLNFLIIEALKSWELVYGNLLELEYPAKSGTQRNLHFIIQDLTTRLLKNFEMSDDESPLRMFECYDASSGRGCGSSRKSWSALVAHSAVNLSLRPTTANHDHQKFPVFSSNIGSDSSVTESDEDSSMTLEIGTAKISDEDDEPAIIALHSVEDIFVSDDSAMRDPGWNSSDSDDELFNVSNPRFS